MADRLVSPAERVERATEPWSTYVVLPVFAFTAAGVSFTVDLGRHDAMVLFGVALALAIGKPIGIILTAWGAAKAKIARFPTAGSAFAAAFGAIILALSSAPVTKHAERVTVATNL